ncbi:jasmonate-induced oxygenase 2-like [Impatiens glandulifera]|uniref:jasmonate-induced oxygenase 2-like n=1 Tax=Impatiens glandulifera TaxID=253017 RepID=UPI001FB05BC3|nr:jasmonate-induced oxygenase 2-like [Impatiens glandulifera]
MTLNLQTWPEPIVRVQSLSESGIFKIPETYIKPPSQRPSLNQSKPSISPDSTRINIPVIDISGLFSAEASLHADTLDLIGSACRDWGFFQAVNHGVPVEMLRNTRETWREFFHLRMEEKQVYANSPVTYEGYGSRLGIEKGAKLDWGDYFFLNCFPESIRDMEKWPRDPVFCREYSQEMVKLGGKLMRALSLILGLKENHLQDAFGGEDFTACLRVNFYPKCPQPDLTLGLSSHSDPGGMTFLYPDENVPGLQVRRGEMWVTVETVPNAIIVNIGDQIQVLSNGRMKSVDHRVMVNSEKERVSMAYFYNPKGDIYIEPVKEFLAKEKLKPLYPRMTYNEYRLFIRMNGPRGKSQVESHKSPN